jgi:hypothetical protein
MGGGGSQTINQTFNMSAVNKSIFNQITKNTQTLATSMNNIQKATINLGLMKSGCTANIGQTIDATSTLSGKMAPQTIAETKDVVSAQMQASAQAAIEKATQAGNFQFGDKQNVNTNVNMAIENVIEKTFSTENLNEVYAEVVNLQEAQVNVKVCDGELNFDQNIVAQLTASAITESLTSAVSDNEVLSSLHAASSGGLKSENKGFAELIDSLFAGLTGPAKYAIIASVVCCCLLVLVMIVIGLSPAGQSATKNLGAAGASRLGGARRF